MFYVVDGLFRKESKFILIAIKPFLEYIYVLRLARVRALSRALAFRRSADGGLFKLTEPAFKLCPVEVELLFDPLFHGGIKDLCL